MRGVVRLRRDLRLRDQPALSAACANCDDVIPLLVFDDPFLRARQFGSPGVTSLVSYLDEFDDALAGCRIGTDCLSPLVDHSQAREEYLALGEQQGTR
jgi:deoxyribodipyrimidine photolyase